MYVCLEKYGLVFADFLQRPNFLSVTLVYGPHSHKLILDQQEEVHRNNMGGVGACHL